MFYPYLQDVQDPSVIVNFPLVESEDVALIAWTTTPWTLPSNLALCVNPEFSYVKVKGERLSLTPNLSKLHAVVLTNSVYVTVSLTKTFH